MSGQLASTEQRSIKNSLEHKLMQLNNDVRLIKHRLLKFDDFEKTVSPDNGKLLQQLALLKAERELSTVIQALEALQQQQSD